MLALGFEHPDWGTDGANWPNRSASRFITAGGLTWHVQEMGPANAPIFLLLHGTGAASHSFRDLMPILSRHWRVIVPDLPGHGFTTGGQSRDLTLPGMANCVAALLLAMDARPARCAGHSAGAAILLQLSLTGKLPGAELYGLNSALEPIRGNALLSPMAKLLFHNPLTSRLVSLQARVTGITDRLLEATGSQIDAAGRECYAMLMRHPSHVNGAIGMMAKWELNDLVRRFGDVSAAVTLIAASDDPMVPSQVSRKASTLIPGCRLVSVDHGGHLLHEVDPQLTAGLLGDRKAEAA
ncbi:MAG: alpha/beta fold hydrolase [Nitratireductor sp.]|nr:alpha/beta fold hydrolase [Nitratireductor sp.]